MKFLTLVFLGAGSAYDMKNKELPGRFLLISAVVSVLFCIFLPERPLAESFCGVLPGVFLLLTGALTKEAVGYGDGIGMMTVGILNGWKKTVLILTGAFFLSALYGGIQLLRRKMKGKDTMPFYPFLFVSALGGMFL